MTYAYVSVTLSRSLSLLYEDRPGDDLVVSANAMCYSSFYHQKTSKEGKE